MRTGLTKQEKTTDIWFDEKDPLIHIRTHNTDLKKRLAAYAGQYPDLAASRLFLINKAIEMAANAKGDKYDDGQ